MTGIILAAGKSKRMGLTHSKVLLPLNGRPVLSYIIELVKKTHLHPILVVISPQGQDIQDTFAREDLQFVIQPEQKGTADAIRACTDALKNSDDIFVLYGDTPLLKSETILALKQVYLKENADVTLLTAYLQTPYGYGRIIRDENRKITAIIEENDANDEIKQIREINVGVYVFRYKTLKPILEKLMPNPLSGEYYLTTALTEIIKQGGKITSVTTQNPSDCLGINTPEDWVKVQQLFAAIRK